MPKDYSEFNEHVLLRDPQWALHAISGILSQANGSPAVVHNLFGMFYNDKKMEQFLTSSLSEFINDPKNGADRSTYALYNLLKATYREGVELHKIFGDAFTNIKLAAATDSKAEALAEIYKTPEWKNNGTEHLAGALHAYEMLYAMRVQSEQALLLEEGLITQKQFDAQLTSFTEFFAARGHHGVYKMVQAHPELDDFLKQDKRKITALYAKGGRKFADMHDSQFTRADYINSEQAYVEATPHLHNAGKYMANAYAQAMGADYQDAYREKAATLSKASAARINRDGQYSHLNLAELSRTPIEDYDNFKVVSRQYMTKHAVGLMNKDIVNALDEAGKFNANNVVSVEHGFHYGMGKPYLTHISELALRHGHRDPFAVAEPATNLSTDRLPSPEAPPEPLPKGQQQLPPPAQSDQKKTPKRTKNHGSNEKPTRPNGKSTASGHRSDTGLTDAEEAKSPLPEAEDATSEPSRSGRQENTDARKSQSDAERTNKKSKRRSKSSEDKSSSLPIITKIGGTALGSILIADQLHRANHVDHNDDPDSKKSKIINYVAATAIAAGVGVLIFTQPEKLAKFSSNLSRFFKNLGKQ